MEYSKRRSSLSAQCVNCAQCAIDCLKSDFETRLSFLCILVCLLSLKNSSVFIYISMRVREIECAIACLLQNQHMQHSDLAIFKPVFQKREDFTNCVHGLWVYFFVVVVVVVSFAIHGVWPRSVLILRAHSIYSKKSLLTGRHTSPIQYFPIECGFYCCCCCYFFILVPE